MITCEKCGTQMLENSTACPGCGAPVAEPAPEEGGAQPQEASAQEPGHGEAVSEPTPVAAPARVTAPQGESRGMSAGVKAIIIAGFAVVVAACLIFWQAKYGGAHAMNSLTPEDMTLLPETFPPMEQLKLSGSADERKKLADDLKRILAVAEQARKEGYADKPEVKRQFDATRILVVAQTFVKKQRDANAQAADGIPKPEEAGGSPKTRTRRSSPTSPSKTSRSSASSPTTGPSPTRRRSSSASSGRR